MTPKGNVLVTGGAHRLGRAFSLAFSRAGYRVAIHYGRSREKALETRGEIEAEGGSAAAFQADLSELAEVTRLIQDVGASFQVLDVLVHSASPWLAKTLRETTAADWDAAFRVGPRAAFFLCQAAHDLLRSARGAVLLISDVAAVRPWPRHIAHATAKAAIDALVRNLAVAMAPEIRVNGLTPGIVLPPEEMTAEEKARLVSRTPLARTVAVEDVTTAAIAIVENRSMTGQIVAIDAGRSVV